jgi:hypothetical protein
MLKIRLPAQPQHRLQTASTLPKEELALNIPSSSDGNNDISASDLKPAQWIKGHSVRSHLDSEPELEPPCDNADETFTSFLQKFGKRTHHAISISSEDEENVQLPVDPSPCKARRIERDSSALAET